MRKLITFLLMSSCLLVNAQNNLTTTIIEGSKTLVDFLRVFKTPKVNMVQIPATNHTTASGVDSIYSKGFADITYKNPSGKTMEVSLYKRNGALYAATSLTLRIGNNSQESLFEISSDIYKYKTEYEDADDKKVIYREDEMKIILCDKLVKQIKKE